MITIATRGSALAQWQARHVQALLLERLDDTVSELQVIRTTGDRITDKPLSQIGDRGLFTRELDAALLDGRAHCAVHSLKDIPTQAPDGLHIAAVLERADPHDAWLARDGASIIATLQRGGTVGTSSLRRRALIREQRPDLNVVDVRGNLDTRLEKLAQGEYDAMVLAHAGIVRLGREDAVTALLDMPRWLPAPGQGAIAIVVRADDTPIRDAIEKLNDYATSVEVRAERALLRSLEGGCQVPIGALAQLRGNSLTLHALVADPDGVKVIRANATGRAEDAEFIGANLASRMIADGAREILDALRNAPPHSVDLP